MNAFKALLATGLVVVIAGCTTEEGDSTTSGGFSTCNMSKTNEQVRWCLAGEGSENLYRASGRHQLIYSRFNDLPGLAKEGLSLCLTEDPERSYVNACRPDEVLAIAKEQITTEDASTCEAVLDPRKSLMGC